jgi:D-glycero-D-manno-heptose 1,7-bisphosphate phosphatase
MNRQRLYFLKYSIMKILRQFTLFILLLQGCILFAQSPFEVVDEINLYLKSQLGIDQVYCCFHDGKENCDCRKPKPGMLLSAAEEWGVELSRSFMIGDRWRDIDTAKAAGVTSILIDYNYDEKRSKPDFECTDFTSAVQYILNFN